MYKICYRHLTTLMVDIEKDLQDFLQLIIQDQYEGTAHASENVGPSSLEEGLAALITCNLPPAVHGASVHNISCNASQKVR